MLSRMKLYCCQCDYHLVLPDIDPDDIETKDDVAIVCQLVPNEYIIPDSPLEPNRSAFMEIIRGCKKTEWKVEARPLSWCPLRGNNDET